MKKIILMLLMMLSIPAIAQHNHHGGYYRGNNWIAPVIIGGVIGYSVARANTPPVYVAPPYVPVQPYVPSQAPYGYHWEQLLDANCNCYKIVLIPN